MSSAKKPLEESLGLPPEVLEFSGVDRSADTDRLIQLISLAKRLAQSDNPDDRQKASGILELVSYRLSVLQSDLQSD